MIEMYHDDGNGGGCGQLIFMATVIVLLFGLVLWIDESPNKEIKVNSKLQNKTITYDTIQKNDSTLVIRQKK